LGLRLEIDQGFADLQKRHIAALAQTEVKRQEALLEVQNTISGDVRAMFTKSRYLAAGHAIADAKAVKKEADSLNERERSVKTRELKSRFNKQFTTLHLSQGLELQGLQQELDRRLTRENLEYDLQIKDQNKRTAVFIDYALKSAVQNAFRTTQRFTTRIELTNDLRKYVRFLLKKDGKQFLLAIEIT
jgi:hypothetical protein